MAQRPQWILFDVVDTAFSTARLRTRLEEAGLDGSLVPLWLARTLRDGFALEVTGGWRPYLEVAEAALAGLAVEEGQPLDDTTSIMTAFAELPAHEDLRPALELARDAGVPCALFSNLPVATATALLKLAGLEALMPRLISTDQIQHWKPLWDVYLHAADTLGIEPNGLAMVSAHAWDIEGAHQAMLTTAWLPRTELQLSPLATPPDITAGSLVEAVERLVALPRGPSLRLPSETLH